MLRVRVAQKWALGFRSLKMVELTVQLRALTGSVRILLAKTTSVSERMVRQSTGVWGQRILSEVEC